MHQDPTSPSDDMTVNRCQDLPPVSVVTPVAPVGAQQTLYAVVGGGQVGVDPGDHVALVGEPPTLYVTALDRLYAVHASDGTVRWCQQVQLTQERIQEWSARPDMRHRPPPSLLFGTARVANGVVYVGATGYNRYTHAFNAGDGRLRWRTPTDGGRVDIPFADYAVPLVRDGIVYTGTYALQAQDGAVLCWRIAIDTHWLSPQALVDDTLYAVTQSGVYAINAQNGEVRWRFESDAHMHISGPLVVADHLLYAGTSGTVAHPEQSRCYALDAETGTLRWEYPLGNSYVGAVIHDESIYVSSRDRHLYALEKHSGSLRWKYRFAYPTVHTATIVGNVVYINFDGAYALSSVDGTLLWHRDLKRCTPSVVFDGVVYLASGDGRGRSMLYALDASNGTEYWHKPYPSSIALLAVVTSAFSSFATRQSNGNGPS